MWLEIVYTNKEVVMYKEGWSVSSCCLCTDWGLSIDDLTGNQSEVDLQASTRGSCLMISADLRSSAAPPAGQPQLVFTWLLRDTSTDSVHSPCGWWEEQVVLGVSSHAGASLGSLWCPAPGPAL